MSNSQTAQTKRGKRPLSKFWKGFFVAVAAFVLLIIVALFVLWAFLSDYEKSRPTNVVESIVEELNDKNYASISTNFNIVKSGFMTSDEVDSHLASVIGTEKVAYSKAFSADRIAHPVFNLTAGEKKLATLTLKISDKKSSFKQNLYEVEYFSTIYSENPVLTLTVPSSYTVSIDDVLLGKEWIHSEQAAVVDSDFTLNEDAKSLRLNIYKIDGVLASSKITVAKSDGTEVKPTKNKDKSLSVNYETLIIEAPQDYKVVVNDVDISRGKWQMGKPSFPEILSRIPDSYFPSKPSYVKYKVTGLLDSSKISVTSADGVEANATKNNETGELFADFISDNSKEKEYKALALEIAKLYARTTTNDYSKSSFLSKIPSDLPLKDELSLALRPEFYTRHTGYGFEDEKTFNLRVFSKDCFSCDVSLTQWITGVPTDPKRVDKFSSKMRICMMKIDGTWRLAEWMLI